MATGVAGKNEQMSTPVAIALTIAILVVLALAIGLAISSQRRKRERQRHERIRDTTGPEYDRQAERRGGQAAASDRIEARRRQLSPRQLTASERSRYSREWNEIQNAFLDHPALALAEADDLVAQLIRDRGFMADDVDDAALDLSLEHRSVAERYRAAHDILDSGSTEIGDLRAAMLHYRTVVDDLLAVDVRGTQTRSERDL